MTCRCRAATYFGHDGIRRCSRCDSIDPTGQRHTWHPGRQAWVPSTADAHPWHLNRPLTA